MNKNLPYNSRNYTLDNSVCTIIEMKRQIHEFAKRSSFSFQYPSQFMSSHHIFIPSVIHSDFDVYIWHQDDQFVSRHLSMMDFSLSWSWSLLSSLPWLVGAWHWITFIMIPSFFVLNDVVDPWDSQPTSVFRASLERIRTTAWVCGAFSSSWPWSSTISS